MLTFAIEPLEQAWNEMIMLAHQHWNETQQYRHSQPFSPSFDRYNQYAKAGWFILFTARDNGKMVGYAGVYLTPSMHTQQLICTEDTWYLTPEYRKGWNAVRFFKFMENTVREKGAIEICLTAPHTTKAGKIHEYLGYTQVSNQYSKNLGSADSAYPQLSVGEPHVLVESSPRS
jgi:hypothetical protein